MSLWWDGLTVLEKALYFIAIPSTVVMVIQTMLLAFGIGGHGDMSALPDHDGVLHDAIVTGHSTVGHPGVIGPVEHPAGSAGDLPSDTNPDSGAIDAATFRLFSLRGVLSFLVVFGWVGIAMDSAGSIAPVVVILVSFVTGVAALYLTAWMLYRIQKLQSSGNIALQDAVGHVAEVYIPIPAAQQGTGKVNLLLQERWLECDAMTESPHALPTGAPVRVTNVQRGSILVVEPVE